jgi:hypothetical protein
VKDIISGMGVLGCSLLLIVVLVFGGGILGIVYLNTLGVPTMNAQRQVTTHSQQYVQTQQQVIINYYADWTKAIDVAHKNAAVLQVCAQAAMLDPVEYPAQVAPFIAQHCQ